MGGRGAGDGWGGKGRQQSASHPYLYHLISFTCCACNDRNSPFADSLPFTCTLALTQYVSKESRSNMGVSA